MALSNQLQEQLTHALEDHGLRSTRQREHIFGMLTRDQDHPTADEVYIRAKDEMRSISLATVYNCLETLVQCGLVRQVNFEREPSRYCANLQPHAHFHDSRTGEVQDIPLSPEIVDQLKALIPAGTKTETINISFQGRSAPVEGSFAANR